MSQEHEATGGDLTRAPDGSTADGQGPAGAGNASDAAAWAALLARHAQGHLLQADAWARLKCSFGWEAARVLLRAGPGPDAPVIGGASILLRRQPWGQMLAYVPKGPVVDWSDPAQARAVLSMIREAGRRRRAFAIKVEPELAASPELAALLAGCGYRPSPQPVQPRSTIHIDLTADEEAILGRMKPKWRYNIRLAERKGVVVREGAAADLPAIQRLMAVTGARDGFGVRSPEYFARATALLVPAGLGAWLVAEHEDRMLAAIGVFALGRTACYLWGASGEDGRNLMPNHALQWAAIRWARARGCTTYDLWGIPDEVGEAPEAFVEPESWGQGGLWGVYRFKQGFGGRVVRYAGAWDLPLSRAGYALYLLALRVRRAEGG